MQEIKVEQYTKHQKIILTIYAILSLPLLPMMAILYPFLTWIFTGVGEKYKLSLLDFLCMSMAVSLPTYIVLVFFRYALHYHR